MLALRLPLPQHRPPRARDRPPCLWTSWRLPLPALSRLTSGACAGSAGQLAALGSTALARPPPSVPDLVPNTKITFKVEDGHAAGANTSGKFGVETVQDFGVSAGVKAELDAVQGDGSFSLLLKKSGVLVGASTAFTTPLAPVAAPAEGEKAKAASFALTDYDAVLGYTTGAATFAVQSEKKFSAATGYVHAEVTPQVKVAGKATVSLAGKAKGPGSPIKGAIGGSYVVDKDVTLYGAVSDAAVLQGAAVLQVAPKATLTVYGEIDALNVEQDGKHFFGTKLALRA